MPSENKKIRVPASESASPQSGNKFRILHGRPKTLLFGRILVIQSDKAFKRLSEVVYSCNYVMLHSLWSESPNGEYNMILLRLNLALTICVRCTVQCRWLQVVKVFTGASLPDTNTNSSGASCAGGSYANMAILQVVAVRMELVVVTSSR